MDKTLYITDLDGTLLRSDESLSDYTVETINRFIDAGGLFTYATARSYASAHKLLTRLHLSLPAVVFNGTFLVDPQSGVPLHACLLAPDTAQWVLDRTAAAGFSPIVYARVDGQDRFSWWMGHESEGVLHYVHSHENDPRSRGVTDPARLVDGEVSYVTLIADEAGATRAHALLAGEPSIRAHLTEDTYFPGDFWLEISRHDTGKDAALRRVKKMIGARRAVAFGDNHNDLPLFAAADEGYAVANARPALLEAATGVLATNDEDGVARFLEGVLRKQ